MNTRTSCVTRAFCGLVLVSALAPATGWACVDGTRSRTPEEQEHIRKLAASLKAAMPAAPAPLALEREPEVVIETACKDTPVGVVGALATASYAASVHYSDRVKLTIRANYAFPGAKDEVLGSLPKKPAAYKVHNLVVNVDGYKAEYMDAVRQALDRARLQALIGKPLPDEPPPPAWTVQAPGGSRSSNSPGTAGEKAAGKPSLPDPAQAVTDQAKDAVNKLRGLFGR